MDGSARDFRRRDLSSRMPPELESTATLLELIRGGNASARARLFERVLPLLTHWAERRLPGHARSLSDTQDLVQVTLVRAFQRVDSFEARGEGAFLAYLRAIFMNVLRDEVDRAAARRPHEELNRRLADHQASPLERTIGLQQMARYESALQSLGEEPRQAVILRLEFDFTHQQIAEALGKPSADAARMTVARALTQLARMLHEHGPA